ncbi:sulfatase-like hydrolase/transferase [Planctomycetota bacterium]
MRLRKNRSLRGRFNSLPWLKRRVRKFTSGINGRRAYRQRSREIEGLLEKYGLRQSETGGPKHIIFVVVDCFRRDHLSLYNYDRQTTPMLDSLSENAAVFENAITASPWTYPSVGSVLTGFYPHNHGGTHQRDPSNFDLEYPSKILREIMALPEMLSTFGSQTYFTTPIAPATLVANGWFEHSYTLLSKATRHIEDILKWLGSRKDQNTFVYFQPSDLHVPIEVPKEYRKVFGEIPDIPDIEGWQFRNGTHLGEPAFERYRENRIKLYDCAVRFVDAQIARFLKGLEELNLRDSSLIVITADHGEEFWDHAKLEKKHFYDPRGIWGVGHGHNLFQEIIGVPLICLGPGMTPGRYSHNVSLVDLVPTVLSVCGIEKKLELDGRSLFDNSEERFVLSEGIAYGNEKKAILRKNWKLIHSKSDKINLLFDLSRDPKEQHDLATRNTKELRRLQAVLPKTNEKGGALQVDKSVEAQLRALGYI